MRPPKLIKPYIVSFSRQVIGAVDAMPFYIPCTPLHNFPHNECFSLVESYVALHGGNMVLGWAIWEYPKAFIEAEFHAVWCAPDGSYLDISPRNHVVPRVLFIPDVRRKYNGTQVDNIRKPLTKDKNIENFLSLRSEYFRLLNEGDLKHQLGEISATPKILANIKEATILEEKLLRHYGPCYKP